MLFGLANAPSSFQHYINDTLREYLDVFCTTYLDDILIYSETLKEHRQHIHLILQALRKVGLYAEIEKCQFHVQEAIYLGLVISHKGIKKNPQKVETVREWPQPQNLKNVQSFLGFANFYRQFVDDYLHICAPLTALLRKRHAFSWSDACQMVFEQLKDAFTALSVLAYFDSEKAIILETDASDFISAGILSQYLEDGMTLQPVAYFSKKHTAAECNYEIYNIELLAII